jgi:NhaP-type Na+/H+ and K+/H+ antiporter
MPPPAARRWVTGATTDPDPGAAVESVAIAAALFVAYGVVSRRLESTLVTGPMAFVAAGLLLGDGGLVGAVVGFLGGAVIDNAARRGVDRRGVPPAVDVRGRLCAFALSELLGGNGFIAAFVAGSRSVRSHAGSAPTQPTSPRTRASC